MKSSWSDQEAERYVERYAQQGVNADIALRVYTSRLLGRDPALVLHGGGNTSVKTTVPDHLGRPTDVLCVKGSGWDMAGIEPAGLPAVRLAPIIELRGLSALSDEDMVNVQRCNLLDASAPNPSVETLLHAFLPHKFVDHTHAIAVLSVSDQPDGDGQCRAIYGSRMGYVPYIMPGFLLAKKAAEVFEANPSVDGLILEKHGIFTFGDNARQAYDRMIEMVSLAEARRQKNCKSVFLPSNFPKHCAPVAIIAPILRGLIARGEIGQSSKTQQRMILDFRTSPMILNYVNGRDLEMYSQVGVVTPDHTIRTKNWPLVVPRPDANDLASFQSGAAAALKRFAARYHDYFQRHNKRQNPPKVELDPLPRVILVPGVGLFGLGNSMAAARIASDVAENTIQTITDAEAIGRYQCVSEADMFDIEYWSLEQAKLGIGKEPKLARHVVVVTGGASGIGRATAQAFKREGAEVVLLDIADEPLALAAKALKCDGFVCDVTNTQSVKDAFSKIAARFGGVDIVVSNAGRAWQGKIGTVDEQTLRDSFELNFYGHQRVAQAAVEIMSQQGFGGVLLFNISKQAINPGPNFGPYGLPKAAALALMRQYAVDHGAEGIRANAVNADRIRSGLLTDSMIAERSKARGVTAAEYMGGNLLAREVTAEDVAQAFVNLALAEKTTGAILTVDGGNIAAAVR
ncbi:MAG: bifunctional aldolase/short-chain dehydrogenase [Rhodospirillaceae bacterium]|nr:bifunctional aldolase/short-chain dehydrogenase [Rhodospirillaceae bacterium]